MKCPKCSRLNEDNALYCNNCGTRLNEKNKDWYSIFLLAYCVSLIFFSVLYLILRYAFDFTNATWQTVNYIYIGLAIVQSLLTFIIPLGIQKLWMKIVAFIIVGIAAIINIIQNIMQISHIANMDY